jgi:hypothetical protein
MSSIFQMITDQFEGSIKTITDAANKVEQEVTNPVKSLIGVVQGGIWKGDGANRFMNDMTSQILPMLASLMTVNLNFGGAFSKAESRMGQALQESTRLANSLNDIFNAIF